MRRYSTKDGSLVLSKVQRTAIFDSKTGIDYPNGAAIVDITFDELKELHDEAKKRLKSCREKTRNLVVCSLI